MSQTLHITQKNQIRALSKVQYQILRGMCHTSKNLYNFALYNIRQEFFAGNILSYESNYYLFKENENYKLLQAGVAQQTAKSASEAFNSFLALKQLAAKGLYPSNAVKIPNYLPKDGCYSLSLSSNAITIKNGKLVLPLSNEFRKQHPDLQPILIPFPHRLDQKALREIRIIPKNNARYFEIEFVCQIDKQAAEYWPIKALSLDLGLDNFATCVSTDGASFLIDGKGIKSVNHWYNKQRARLQSIKDLQGFEGETNRLADIARRRNNQVRDYLNKTARYIINYCVTEGIAKLIVGSNLQWKQAINLGKQNNQNFVQIPHSLLKRKIEGMCQRYCIEYVEQEESYTSAASFLDGDNMPVYGVDEPDKFSFSGKRISRGQYRTANGRIINADVNAAANILCKSNHGCSLSEMAKGLLASPLRLRIR
jgi:putative transposase